MSCRAAVLVCAESIVLVKRYSEHAVAQTFGHGQAASYADALSCSGDLLFSCVLYTSVPWSMHCPTEVLCHTRVMRNQLELPR